MLKRGGRRKSRLVFRDETVALETCPHYFSPTRTSRSAPGNSARRRCAAWMLRWSGAIMTVVRITGPVGSALSGEAAAIYSRANQRPKGRGSPDQRVGTLHGRNFHRRMESHWRWKPAMPPREKVASTLLPSGN